ncbi:hypothetical protein [Dysgonomonas sp. 521]|uniref:hypothetical protein n=1 Tax=Dysgonomonas sp. 521 TaxID=2302932 RepID=UPI00210211E7|nr:hypothetical protein [Dysgonomonas sp. 521]
MSNPALKSEVHKLISEVDKTHRYSMSRIYGLYNEVFGKDEAPQSCASCLIRKVKELKTWLAAQPEDGEPAQADASSKEIQATDPAPAKASKKRAKNGK